MICYSRNASPEMLFVHLLLKANFVLILGFILICKQVFYVGIEGYCQTVMEALLFFYDGVIYEFIAIAIPIIKSISICLFCA